MVRSKEINYICVELYLKYLETFLHRSQLPSDIMDRFKRMKVLKHSDAIEENSLPCFLVEAYKRTIDKVNSQTLKFLRIQRYEIKDKVFTNFIVPEIGLKEL
jgi:hypothetical protein